MDHTQAPQFCPAPVVWQRAARVVTPASTAAEIARSLTTLQWHTITAVLGFLGRSGLPNSQERRGRYAVSPRIVPPCGSPWVRSQVPGPIVTVDTA